MKMKLNKKLTTLGVLMASAIFSNQAFALQAGSELSDSMQGYRPYLESVGSRILSGGKKEIVKDKNDQDVEVIFPKVGTVLEVPTYLLEEAASKFYQYKDLDLDKDADLQDSVVVKWYIIEPIEGRIWAPLGTTKEEIVDEITSQNRNWVTAWEHVKAIEITDRNALVRTSNNIKSYGLRVPATIDGQITEGKRLGFSIVPKSKTGEPDTGLELFAFDLFFFWGQDKPVFPGAPNPTDKDPGKPGEGNPDNGGGGIRPGNLLEFTIFDTQNTPELDDDVIVSTTTHTLVNRTYRVEVTKRSGDGSAESPIVYEPIPEEDQKYIKWQLWDTSVEGFNAGLISTDSVGSVGTNGLKGSFSLNDEQPSVQARFVDISDDTPSYMYFKTQETNPDAIRTHTKNLSEQGLKLRVVYDDAAANE